MSFNGPRKASKSNVPRLPADQVVTCEVDHSRLVNNETTHLDVFFYFMENEDKNLLGAHYNILKVRCPQLLEGAVKKKKCYAINLNKIKKAISSHVTALQRLLIYLYCGQLDYSMISPILSVEIIHVALAYNITHLYQITKKHLYSILSLDNVFEVLSYASSLGLDDVKSLCFDFAMQNPDFFMSKESKTLPFELYQEAVGVLTEHYRSGEPHQMPDLRVMEYDKIVDNFKDLFISRNETADLSFVVKGKMIKAHRCVLSALSLKLDELINTPEGVVVIHEEKFPRLTPQALEDSLRYFYYNQENLELLNVCYMIEFVKEMELSKLLRVLEKNIAASPITIDSAPFLLEVGFTQLDENPDLKQKLKERSLSFVIEHMDEIDFAKFEIMPPIISTTVLIGIQKIVQSASAGTLPEAKVLDSLPLNISPRGDTINQKMDSARSNEGKMDSGRSNSKPKLKTKDLRMKDKRKSVKL